MSKVLINNLGLNRSAIDHSIFYRQNVEEHLVVAVASLATDDMAVTLKRAVDATKFKADISKHWEITDHGPINWFWDFKLKGTENRELYP
jgi:molybdopterin synthase catalytic subunit